MTENGNAFDSRGYAPPHLQLMHLLLVQLGQLSFLRLVLLSQYLLLKLVVLLQLKAENRNVRRLVTIDRSKVRSNAFFFIFRKKPWRNSARMTQTTLSRRGSYARTHAFKLEFKNNARPTPKLA